MAKKKKTRNVSKPEKPKLVRTHAITTMFNDAEFEAFERYCKQFKVNNKSKLIREMILGEMWKDFHESYPTLFDKQEMADLIKERK